MVEYVTLKGDGSEEVIMANMDCLSVCSSCVVVIVVVVVVVVIVSFFGLFYFLILTETSRCGYALSHVPFYVFLVVISFAVSLKRGNNSNLIQHVQLCPSRLRLYINNTV